MPVYELIDTLWNVNKVAVAELKNDIWINRYIMECKWCRVKRVANDGYELIDTLWNVNWLMQMSLSDRSTRINRYIMECKCH